MFDIVSFPAEEDGKWLFPERYDEAWYKAERAFAGSYGWAAQFQQEPTARKGNMFQTEVGVNIHIVDDIDDMAGDSVIWEWGVDLASTSKERNKADPDFTHGSLSYLNENGPLPSLYIKDVFELRQTALERDDEIKRRVERSGASRANIEAVGGYKDAYIYLKNILAGICLVHKVTVQKDLVSRATFLEPVFEAGNVYIQRAAWNKKWLQWFQAFPNGKHDDAIASLLAAVYKKLSRKGSFQLTR